VADHENNVERRMPKDTSELKQFMVEEFLRKQYKI